MIQNFSEINKKINELIGKSEKTTDVFKKLFREDKVENLTTNLFNGIISIGCNYLRLMLTVLSVGFQNKERFNN